MPTVHRDICRQYGINWLKTLKAPLWLDLSIREISPLNMAAVDRDQHSDMHGLL